MGSKSKRPGRHRGVLSPSVSGQHDLSKSQIRSRVDFAAISAAVLGNLIPILHRWLPDGQRQGDEYLALNPHRDDRRLGSFRINLRTGKWADFATDDKGGDVISLAAFLFGLSQVEAARKLANMLGVRL